MIEMTIDSIRVSMMNYQRVVILKEAASERYLPIWIGPAEADAIAVQLQGISVPRPLTHDLLQSIIGALGARIDHIVVNDLRNDTFFAKITLKVDGTDLEIDSRPSDAIAIAVRAKAPIYADESVLDKAGIFLDTKTGKPLTAGKVDGQTEGGAPVSEEEAKNMSAFLPFIDTLDLEDFGKRKS